MIFPFKRRREKENLISRSVYIQDTSANSPQYFVINNYPTEFTSGKNAIRLLGSTNLIPGSEILVEVLDNNGNPIYSEVNDYRDQHNNFIISVSVYDDTAAGVGSITLLGKAKIGPNNERLPDQWQNQYNVRWSKPITISPTKRNDSEILIAQPPNIQINQIILPYNETVPNTNPLAYTVTDEYTQYLFQNVGFIGGASLEYTYDIPKQKDIFNPREGFTKVNLNQNIQPVSKTTNMVDGTISKKIKDVFNGVQLQDLAAYNNIIYISSSVSLSLSDGSSYNYSGGFTDDLIGAQFQSVQFGSRLPQTASGLIVDQINTNETYTATILDVIDSTRAVVSTPYIVKYRSSTRDGRSALTDHRYLSFTQTTASISYKTPPTYITSSLISQSMIYFTVSDLSPISGDIYRMKTYKKDTGVVGDYTLISDNVVTAPEILVDNNTLSDKSYINTQFKWYGNLTYSNITNYWLLLTDTGVVFNEVLTGLQNYTSSVPLLNSYVVDKERYEDLNGVSLNSLALTAKESEFFKINQTYRLTLKLVADFESGASSVNTCELEVYASSEQLLGSGNPAITRAFEPSSNIDKTTQKGILSRYGKLLGRIKSTKGVDRYKPYGKISFEFNADAEGIGRILFRVKSGAFHISEVHLTPAVYNGFTPNYLTYTVPIGVGDETSWGITSVSQSIDFKFEYFDYLGRQSDYVTYLPNVRVNELQSLPSLGCNRLLITQEGIWPDISTATTNFVYYYLKTFSNFSRQSGGLFSFFPGGYDNLGGGAGINYVVEQINSASLGTANYPLNWGWNYQRYSGSYYTGSFPGNVIRPSETFGGTGGLNATATLQPFSANWNHSSSWIEGYHESSQDNCACISKPWVSESWRRFNDLGSSGFSKSTANTYLKQTRLYWPATTGSVIGAANQYTPFNTNGGIYKVRFKLMGIPTALSGAAANVYATTNGIDKFESDNGGVLNVYIYDVGSGVLGTSDKSQLQPGIASWYPYSQNIFQIKYNDIAANYPLTSSYIQYETFLVQWGLKGRLVFEASGSGNSFFGGCVDDIEVCQVGTTTDSSFTAPPTYLYDDSLGSSVPAPPPNGQQ